ncbi:MAG: hypothetical protein M1839_004757 [Geoglossum umbratile]|nr:MAG: hypothetical protein M1839_004757 [Geoglossum umbratile]
MAIPNASDPFTAAGPSGVVHGWVSQPDYRGTIDILWSCIVTIALCCWTILCPNVPPPGEGWWRAFTRKCSWAAFIVSFPEISIDVAGEQWESARQSAEDFSRIGYPQWTMRHGFLADMGGFILQTPNFPAFPVDAVQLHYLVEKKYIPFPDISVEMIRDKSKADGLARAIALFQTIWFALQCIGRAAQRLHVTTFELTTLGFVLCAVPMSLAWHLKPLDVEEPIVLTLSPHTSLEDILKQAGERADQRYDLTPLDFIAPPPTNASHMATPFWVAMWQTFKIFRPSDSRPAKRFRMSKRAPPRGLNRLEIVSGTLLAFAYTGLHLVGWNLSFPTRIEQIFWRASSLVLMGVGIGYLLFMVIGVRTASYLSLKFFHVEAKTLAEMLVLLPLRVQLLIYIPPILLYGLARLYILADAFASLRALPASAYTQVDWAGFVPHL